MLSDKLKKLLEISLADKDEADELNAAIEAATGDADPTKLPLDGGTMDGDINMGGNTISNLADPTDDQDAATKAYVDANSGGGSVDFTDVESVTFKFTDDAGSVFEMDGAGAINMSNDAGGFFSLGADGSFDIEDGQGSSLSSNGSGAVSFEAGTNLSIADGGGGQIVMTIAEGGAISVSSGAVGLTSTASDMTFTVPIDHNFVFSGQNLALTNDSLSIVMASGASLVIDPGSGQITMLTPASLRIQDGTQGNVGDVFTQVDSDGQGAWSTPSGLAETTATYNLTAWSNGANNEDVAFNFYRAGHICTVTAAGFNTGDIGTGTKMNSPAGAIPSAFRPVVTTRVAFGIAITGEPTDQLGIMLLRPDGSFQILPDWENGSFTDNAQVATDPLNASYQCSAT